MNIQRQPSTHFEIVELEGEEHKWRSTLNIQSSKTTTTTTTKRKSTTIYWRIKMNGISRGENIVCDDLLKIDKANFNLLLFDTAFLCTTWKMIITSNSSELFVFIFNCFAQITERIVSVPVNWNKWQSKNQAIELWQCPFHKQIWNNWKMYRRNVENNENKKAKMWRSGVFQKELNEMCVCVMCFFLFDCFVPLEKKKVILFASLHTTYRENQ